MVAPSSIATSKSLVIPIERILMLTLSTFSFAMSTDNFRKFAKILSESDEYYIIAEGNSYSLSNYDHIALNGDSVRDNQIVSQ